jgi:cytochrome c55X
MSRILPVLCLCLAAATATQASSEALDTAALERLVLQDCGSCHGLTRKGGLGPDLRADSLAHWQPEDLALVILEGIPGTAMPPWRPIMSDREALWIARYLLSTE